MTPGKRMLHHWARLRPVGFAQLTIFLGIILLATPLRQERWIFSGLLQLMFLDALLVSLSASGMRRRLRWAFFGVWAAGFGAKMVYFSLVTLATLGYGDVFPSADPIG